MALTTEMKWKCALNPIDIVGFGKFEHWVYRSAAERQGRPGARSQAGDVALTICSLRKWARLALPGNPTVLLLSYLPDDAIVGAHECWRTITETCARICLQACRQTVLGIGASDAANAGTSSQPFNGYSTGTQQSSRRFGRMHSASITDRLVAGFIATSFRTRSENCRVLRHGCLRNRRTSQQFFIAA